MKSHDIVLLFVDGGAVECRDSADQSLLPPQQKHAEYLGDSDMVGSQNVSSQMEIELNALKPVCPADVSDSGDAADGGWVLVRRKPRGSRMQNRTGGRRLALVKKPGQFEQLNVFSSGKLSMADRKHGGGIAGPHGYTRI